MNSITDCVLLNITKNLIQRCLDRKISDELIRKLVVIMGKKKRPFLFTHRNKSPYNLNVKIIFEKNLFTKKKIDADINSFDPDEITQMAAVGFVIIFFFKTHPNITTIKVCLKKQGYDYICREEDKVIKIEISGVNSKIKNTFNSRVSDKKNKFEKNLYEPLGDEELIGIVDFFYYKYRILKIR